MARKRTRGNKWQAEHTPLDVAAIRALSGRGQRTETGRDGTWLVRNIAAGTSAKEYTCPGCFRTIAPGIAHLVAWREDGPTSEQSALADRRHWHTQCWAQRARR